LDAYQISLQKQAPAIEFRWPAKSFSGAAATAEEDSDAGARMRKVVGSGTGLIRTASMRNERAAFVNEAGSTGDGS